VDECCVQILVVVAIIPIVIRKAGEDEGSCVFQVDEVSREPKWVARDLRKETGFLFAGLSERSATSGV